VVSKNDDPPARPPVRRAVSLSGGFLVRLLFGRDTLRRANGFGSGPFGCPANSKPGSRRNVGDALRPFAVRTDAPCSTNVSNVTGRSPRFRFLPVVRPTRDSVSDDAVCTWYFRPPVTENPNAAGNAPLSAVRSVPGGTFGRHKRLTALRPAVTAATAVLRRPRNGTPVVVSVFR